MRGALAAVVVLVAACGGGKAQPAAKPIGPAIDEKTAESDAKGLVTELYDTINRGKPDSLFSLLSDPLILFGPRRMDASVTRSEALVALGKLIDPKGKAHPQVRSGALAVVPSPGGHSAWAFDVVSVDGAPVVALGVLTNDNDLWAVSAAALAKTPPLRDVRAEMKKAAVVPPGATSQAKVDERAKGAVDRFKSGLADGQTWGEDLGSRTEAIVIGPAKDDITRGKKDIKKLWKKRTDAETRAAISGELAAGTTPDGQLAWVTAPVTRVEKDEEGPIPLRVFAVFEKSGDAWKMIALEESVAIDEPGAATPFLKIVPPPPKPPEPTAEEKEAAETAKKEKEKAEKDKKEAAEKERKDKEKAEKAEKAKKKKKSSDEDEASDDDKPKAKKKKKFSNNDEMSDEDDKPKAKKKKKSSDDDEVADDDKPKAKKKKASAKDEDSDDEDKPKAKKKKKKLSDDDEISDDDDKPKAKKKKKKLSDDDEISDDDDDKPKAKKKKKASDDDEVSDDDDEKPKKKKKKRLSDDDE